MMQMVLNNWTYCGLVMPYGNIDMGQHWLSNGLLHFPWSVAPAMDLSQDYELNW